jgi:hypothetical protein
MNLFLSKKTRQLLTLFSFCLLSIPVLGQNVGIGTNAPTGKLHINMTGDPNLFAVIIDDDDADNTTVRLRKAGVSKSFLTQAGDDLRIGTYATNPNGGISLQTNSTNRVFIASDGNTGVGTLTPAARLHIGLGSDVSLSSNGYFLLGNDNGTNITMDNNEIQARNDSVASTLFIQPEGGRTKLGNNSDANIEVENTTISALFNGSPETLIFQPNGKTRVGSAFDFSNTKFQISEGVDAGVATNQSGYLMIGTSNGENVVFDNNEILARNNGAAATLFLARDGSKVQLGNGTEASGTKLHITSGNDVGLTDNLSGYVMMGSQAGLNMIADNNEIQVRNNGAASHLYVQNSGGSVYIGDATGFTSDHRLGVDGNTVITGALRVGTTVTPAGYKLAVDGRVICTEVMVRLVNNWPDYVFQHNYKLAPLGEVESFIEKNKHLPGIPSAAKLEKEGLSLGEMQKLQMQKIEELTLYIIDINRQLQTVKQENQQLKAKLALQ